MSEEILQDQENEVVVCHVNARTRPLFKEMLNKVGSDVKVGASVLKYGDAIFKLDPSEFESLFNRWVSKCIKKNLMRKTLSSDCTKQLEWSQELSEVERALEGLEVAKELVK